LDGTRTVLDACTIAAAVVGAAQSPSCRRTRAAFTVAKKRMQ
jgi:hypothetical protein